MEIIKKLFILNIFLFLLPLTSCTKTIVVNNAFVYLVHDSCFSYGTIQGEQWQSVYVGEYSREVVARPKTGYRFVKWSDNRIETNRKDLANNENSNGPIVYYAYFEVNHD